MNAEEESGIRRTFAQFAAFGKAPAASPGTCADGAATPEPAAAGLDSAQFAKLVRDAGLLGRGLNATRADLVFVAATAAAAQKVGGWVGGGGRSAWMVGQAAAKRLPKGLQPRAAVHPSPPARHPTTERRACAA